MIIGGSGSGKTNALLNLIKEQDDIDKIYLYAKDLSEPKYEFLIKKREDVGTNHFDDSNAFTECSNRMNDVYQNIDYYNSSIQIKILILGKSIFACLFRIHNTISLSRHEQVNILEHKHTCS